MQQKLSKITRQDIFQLVAIALVISSLYARALHPAIRIGLAIAFGAFIVVSSVYQWRRNKWLFKAGSVVTTVLVLLQLIAAPSDLGLLALIVLLMIDAFIFIPEWRSRRLRISFKGKTK